jgi:hypothetical protein
MRYARPPDVMVVFGRPKGHRGSYMQWVENNIGPQAAFEVVSPGNRFGEMLRKFRFYERYGVREYYVYDPDNVELEGYLREGNELKEIAQLEGWKSPLLGIKFSLASGELVVLGPDGRPFATYLQLVEQRESEQREKELAQREKDLAQRENDLAQRENDLAQRENDLAQREKDLAQRRAEEQALKVEQLRAQVRTLGEDPVI